jgi:hypothetical protein
MKTTPDQLLDDLTGFSLRVARRLAALEDEIEDVRQLALDALALAGEMSCEDEAA